MMVRIFGWLAVIAFGLASNRLVAQAPVLPPDARLLVERDEQGRERPVRTADDWKRKRKSILAGMEAAMGKLPSRDKLAPLDIRESRRESFDGFERVTLTFAAHRAVEKADEKVDRVPAHLYLPTGHDRGPARPAMLVLHQTSKQGKLNVGPESTHPNLATAAELARRGFVVLAPDYPSFGDYTYDFDADDYVSGTMKGIFNHMRGVDLLIERKDVDRERIGVLGHSLGGHNALFVAAFDERLRVVVTSCGWTPFHDYYGGKLAGWTSARYMPRIRDVYKNDADRVPFDFYGVLAAIAPRAVFTNSPLRDDNFSVAGVKKAIPPVLEVYKLLSAADRLVAKYPDCGHDFPKEVREEAYRFIDKSFTK
jgi:acetyl esterase/lipase